MDPEAYLEESIYNLSRVVALPGFGLESLPPKLVKDLTTYAANRQFHRGDFVVSKALLSLKIPHKAIKGPQFSGKLPSAARKTTYLSFVAGEMKAGKTMKEAAAAWAQRKVTGKTRAVIGTKKR